MRQRLAYLIKFFLLTVLLFFTAKVAFMLLNHEGHTFSAKDVVDVIWHGQSLDFSTSLYILAVPFLLSIVSLWLKDSKWIFRILRVFYAIIATLMMLAFVADTSLYPFWGFKLDATCLQYLETPVEARASVSGLYLTIRILAIIIGAIIIYRLYAAIPQWNKAATHRSSATFANLLLIPLFVIGIRGGLDESTTNIGQVYYSQNQFLNHSAVNPVFSFVASLEKTASVNIVYEYMTDAECNQILEGLFDTQSVESDTLLTTQAPNIIIILMEGCGGEFTEIAGRTDVTPHLNRLMKEGIFFSNCYANSWRTDRGTVCALSGYPSFPTMSVMKISSKTRSLPNIAMSLREQRHYNTHYLYGGDINFTNMRGYLIAGGFAHLISKDDYSSEEQNSSKWGVRDDITFQTLYDMATTAQEPFLIGFSTLSSHQPWDVPIHQFDDEVLNAFYYLDQCIGKFINQFRKTKAWQNTLVILLPDHGIPYQEFDESNPLKNHIPMIWTGGAVRQPRVVEQVCNQTDLPATLLGQLGVSHDEYTFSRDVMSKTYTQPFAIYTHDDSFSLYDSVSFVNYDLIGERIVASQGRKNPRLVERGKAILQAASKDLNER